MLVDEGDELLIGETEYIVLNKYTEDGKKYLFVANVNNPEENIADNFDSDALELLLISQDDVQNDNESNNEETASSSGGFVNQNENIDIETKYEMTNSSDMYDEYSVSNNVVKENSQFFTVEKEQSKIEKILEIMFLK